MGTISFDMNLYSSVLGFKTDINVILPVENASVKESGKYQVLYLFHGGHGDYSDFKRCTDIQHLADERKLAVIMPSVANSYYQDMYLGESYFTYITEELPKLCKRMFPISEKRENTFTGGVSMGGYGAVRAALAKPECYASAISIAGALDFASGMYESIHQLVWNPFKPYSLCEDPLTVRGTKADIFTLARELKLSGKEIPGLYLRTGRQDIFCHHMNVTAKAAFEEEGIPFDYKEINAKHEWGFWSRCLPEALDWLPLTRCAVEE